MLILTDKLFHEMTDNILLKDDSSIVGEFFWYFFLTIFLNSFWYQPDYNFILSP